MIFFSLVGAIIILTGRQAAAQGPNRWTPQQRIPDYGDEARPPVLVADQNRTVHVFNYQPVDDTISAIFYRKWTVADGWSVPNDIILPKNAAEPRLQDAFLDNAGVMHLAFFDGNELGADMYYTRAYVALADQASAWMKPELVGEAAGPAASAAMVGDGQNALYIAYTGRRDGQGLYETHSTDAGNTWTDPILVFQTFEDLQPFGTRLALDPQGNLHAVWSIVDMFGLDQELYYARLEAQTGRWTVPDLLAKRDENDYKSAWPSIIFYDNSLIVVYMDGPLPPTRYMRRSFDGGQSWTQPIRLFPHVGEYEHAVLLVDGNNALHIIMGNRLDESSHGMWHAVWLGDRWGNLEPLTLGPKTPQFDPSAPRAVISQGNVLLASWWTDTGGGPRNGAWFSYATLNAPELPIVALPAPEFTPTPEPAFTPMVTLLRPTPTPRPDFVVQSDDLKDGLSKPDPSTPIRNAVTVVGGIIAVIFLVYRFLLFR